MDLAEASRLLGWKREQVEVVIQDGIVLPNSTEVVRLAASGSGRACDIAEEDLDSFIQRFEQEEPGRHPPAAVRRTLLVEANHRCAICRDSAPLHYHHMIEWSKVHAHDPRHMLAVCGTCHDMCHLGSIDYKAQQTYKDRLTYGADAVDRIAAEGKNRSLDIGRDASDSVNITGDGNLTFKNATIGQLVVVDPRAAPADMRDYVTETGKKPYEIPGVTLHNLPFPQNPMFTGREKLLEKLHESLAASGSTALSQPQAISGLGGIGKTQIAIEYAYRHIKEYRFVLWVNSDGTASITGSYGEIARLLDLPEKNEKDINIIINAVRSWLETHTDWLLIYDNADEPEIITEYLPRSGQGRTLITSRASAFGKLGVTNPIEVDEMAKDEAVEFLLRRAGIEKPQEEDQKIAEEICEKLGLLPLAIDQAGAFLDESKCGLGGYLERFRKKGIEAFEDKRYASGSYKYTVATTWSMSLERLEKENPWAVGVLSLCAFFAPDDIPLELIVKGAGSFGELLKGTVSGSFDSDEALRDLLRYSLVRRRAGENEISIHRLLQAVIRENLGESEARKWAECAVDRLSNALPDVKDYLNWPEYERLMSHILVISQHVDSLDISNETVGYLLNQAGYYLDDRADYAEAEPLYKRALEIKENLLGPEHPSVATSLNNLAELYRAQGRYAEAEQLHRRALEIREKVHGPEHPDVAQSLNNLAALNTVLHKYAEAEPLYQRSLEITERTFGPGHPSVAVKLCNLAVLYKTQSKYAEAEPLFQRALDIDEKEYGPEHPKVATDLNNLAGLFREQGKYAEAELLYNRALEIKEKIHGREHPTVAYGLHNLGTLLYKQGRKEEGIEMLRRAYRIFRDKLGPDHKNTKSVLGHLESWGVKPE